MRFKGKTVLTMETFRLDAIRVGDLVDFWVVEDLCEIMPFEEDFANCAQPDKPIAMKYVPKTGLYYSTFLTFRRVAGWEDRSIWEYCGQCFFAEDEESDEPWHVAFE